MNTLSTDVPLDHVVFYAGHQLGELSAFVERLGFQLTPLGRHNSGSINRLAMLDGQYIELMGFEPGTPPTVRPEVQALPMGLNGVVAADRATRVRRSKADGFLPPVHLERPVQTPHAQGVASFTITNVSEPPPDARAFMCRHHTPHLVWCEAWQLHPNGAVSVAEVCIPTRDPGRLHAAVRRIFDIEGDSSAAAYDAAGTRVRIVSHGSRGSLTVRVRDMDKALNILQRSGLPHRRNEAGSVVVPLPQPYAVDLVFTAVP